MLFSAVFCPYNSCQIYCHMLYYHYSLIDKIRRFVRAERLLMRRNIKPVLTVALLFLITIPVYADTCYKAFPQAQNYPYGIRPNNFTQEQMNQHCLDWFNKWKAKYLTQNNCNPGEWRVQRLETGNGQQNNCYGYATAPEENDTVSEGIGYGMIITVFMSSDKNNTKQYFDGLWAYYKARENGNGVMNWQYPYCTSGNGATDADEDAAFALLMADKQWGSAGAINYANEAKTLISNVLNHEISSTGQVYSRLAVLKAVPRLSPGLSLPTY